MSAHDNKPELSDIALPASVEAALKAWWESDACRDVRESGLPKSFYSIMEAGATVALHSLTCEPVMPSDEDFEELDVFGIQACDAGNVGHWPYMKGWLPEWKRRRFLRKPDPVPEEVKALMWSEDFSHYATEHNNGLMAAYKAGKAAR